MKPIDLVQQYMGEYKIVNDEINVKHCPFCGPNNKSDNQYKFYVSKETGAFQCKRAKNCGAKGSFYELAKHYGVEDEVKNKTYSTKKKKYKKPKVDTKSIDNKVKKYLKARGFYEEIINQLDIKEYDHSYLGECIAFEYYWQDELIFVKYRNFKKKDKGRKYLREKGTRPILWNMDNINTGEPVLITEGEFDAMACFQSGYSNVVSIPSGVDDYNWIDNCHEFIEKVDEFIIWGDNDKAGRKFQEELATKLEDKKCRIVEPIEGINDANELMYVKNEQAVLNAILEAEQPPIEGVIRLADVEYTDEDDEEAVTTGFNKLDRYLSGFGMGQVSIWTGENGSGKSTVLGQVLIESINAGYNVCAFSGELPKKKFRNWIERQLAGKNYIHSYINDYNATKYSVDRDIREYMGKWFYDKFYLFDADKTRVDADKVLNRFKQAAKRYDARVFLIDNLIKMNLDKNNYYAAQSDFIDKCSVFAHKYNAHIHIVAHPRKTNQGVTKMDISGSGDITNLADNVILVVNTSKNKKKTHDAEIGLLKDRWNGNAGIKVKLLFSEPELRFEEVDGNQFEREYGWEKDYEEEGMY